VALLVETSLASGRDILQGVTRYLREHQPWSLYHEPHALTDSLPAWLTHWRGDGIIARVQTRRMAEVIRSTGIPVVDVLGVAPDAGFPLVHVDNRAIAELAAQQFVKRGLRNFGYFGLKAENWSQERASAFTRAVLVRTDSVASFEMPRDTVGQRSWERHINSVARWITTLPKPCGVFVCSDQCGPQVLEGCRRARVSVPDEVAVLGVDNDEPLCEVCDPPLSSMDAGHQAVGYAAAELLARLLKGEAAPQSPLLIRPQRVISRLSTEVLAVDDPAVAAALRLIRNRGPGGLSVDDVARHVALSRSVLQRRFRTLLKRTVHDEILAAKIRCAQDLLLKSKLSLAAIAVRAGFKHQEYMGAVLKARLGQTPAELRGYWKRR
jgi:LacI family transcriptional regulator